MRRQIIILSLVLMVAGFVFAGYPEEYFGPPLPDGCMEVEAWVPHGGFHDMNPWSMPSPEEGIIWFGTLCVDDPVAVLEFTQLTSLPEVYWYTVWRPALVCLFCRFITPVVSLVLAGAFDPL